MAATITREEAVASLYRIYEARSEKRIAEEADRTLGGKVKKYMMSAGEVEARTTPETFAWAVKE